MKRLTFVRSALAATAATALPFPRGLRASTPPSVDGFRALDRSNLRDVTAVTGDGREVTLPSSALDDLNRRLMGRVLLAGDDGYEDARHVLNPSFDKHPALIAQVTGTADIRAAVDFARDHGGLLLAVKCGGHSASGKSTCDRGMMIDLSPFRDVRVDPFTRTARITGGSLLGALDHESMAYDLVTPMGTVSHTGVGGLVTGGGFGRLARRFGMSIDNLLSVDVVTADGELVHASRTEHPDLFWGVRGGGGNFGIVTSFEFRLHPMERTVLAGMIGYPLAQAKEALRVYGEYGPEAPDELQIDMAIVQPPGGAPGMAGFAVCYSGDPGQADRALAPLRAVGTPIMNAVAPTDYVALQRSGDTNDPRAQATYLKSGFIPELSGNLIDAIVDGFEGAPERTTQVIFQQSGGIIGRVPADEAAFSQRDAIANMMGAVNWPVNSDPAEHTAWIRQFWEPLEPYTTGFYVNDAAPDATHAATVQAYRQNHQRLVQVKNRYDPTNLFRLNSNVEPTV
jgi:FAD/FMN-containing dehydrogenase